MSLPTVSAALSLSDLGSNSDSDSDSIKIEPAALRVLGEKIKAACLNGGMFYLVEHGISPALTTSVLQQTAAFFAQSEKEKAAIHIKNASNHRGYGLLKNYRDWREQIHIGLEAPSKNGSASEAYWSLWGPNQWPKSENETFKSTMLDYFQATDRLARIMLAALALTLNKPQDFFSLRMKDSPYLLMKAMSYLPQETAAQMDKGGAVQSGVTAHCDWSWLTFLIQDDVGGLEAQDSKGLWHAVDPIENSIIVNTGELLEIESGGLFPASPHRVINSRIDRQRYSVPVFINPALDSQIYPAGIFTDKNADSKSDANLAASSTHHDEAHIHKVIQPGSKLQDFVFGDSEYERKALGKWCYRKECLVAV